MSGGGSSDHYTHAGGEYDTAFCYEEGTPYWNSLVAWVSESLDLQRGDALADIGGGTGAFTHALSVIGGLGATLPIVVEPSAEMIAHAARRVGLETILSSAVPFLLGRRDVVPTQLLDKVLLKECVHHFDEPTTHSMAALLAETLRPASGRVLIVTRPQEVEYPLWPAARRTWRENQPPAALYERALADAGFTVTTTERRFSWSLPREAWFNHVRARGWSTFSAENFDDEALAAGIAEAERLVGDAAVITFDEVMIFIVGELKSEASSPKEH